MAKKTCSNCGNQIGFWDQNLKFKDKKYICGDCITKYQFSKNEKSDVPTNKAIDWAYDHNYSDFENMINSGKTFKNILDEKNTEIAPTNYKSKSTNPNAQKAAQKINALKIPKEIKKQLIDAEVYDFWFNNKELKSLADIVDYKNGEVIKYAANGFSKNVTGDDGRTVLILCTNRRVIFLNKNMFFGGDSTDIPLNMVNSVQLSTHLVMADITIVNGATTTTITQVSKDAARILTKVIKEEALKFQQNLFKPNATQQPTEEKLDVPDQIRKYKSLADDGIITQEEFNAKKKQLLGL